MNKERTKKYSTAGKAGESWKKILMAHGFRLTRARWAILELMRRSKGHLNAKQIYTKIRKRHSDIGLTTVYRTLDLFVRLRLVYKYEFGDGQSTYELSGCEHHHHLVCSGCGKVIDYGDFLNGEIAFFQRIEAFLSTKYNFEIHDHDVKFYGLCPSCK